MQSNQQYSAGCFKHPFEEFTDSTVEFELDDGDPIIV